MLIIDVAEKADADEVLSATAEWIVADFERKNPGQARIETRPDSRGGLLMIFHPRHGARGAKPCHMRLSYVSGAGPYGDGAVYTEEVAA